MLNWLAGTPSGSPDVTFYWAINTSSTVDYETNYIQHGITSDLNMIIYNLSLNTQYYWTVKAVTDCGASSASSYATAINFTTLSVNAPITWVGGTSTDWNTTANWSSTSVPDENDNVIIPAGCTYYPVIGTVGLSINNTSVTNRCKALYVDENATITVNGNSLYVYCSGEIQISGTFNHNADDYSDRFLINSGGDITVKDGGILNIGSTVISSDIPAGTINQYNDLYINDGQLNIEPGGSVFIQDNLVLTGTSGIKGKINMTGGELWVKYSGSGSSSGLGFDIYANSELSITDGDVSICGQYLGLKMLDWNASATVDISGGNILLINAEYGSTNNIGYVDFKGHTINNLIIDRDSTTYLSTTTDNLVINGNLNINNSSTFSANNLNFSLDGDIANNGTYTPGTGTVKLTGSNKQIKGISITTFYNLIIDNDASYTIAPTSEDRANVNGDLTLNSGSVLNIPSGNMLDFYGDDAIINGSIVAVNNLDGARDFDLNNNASLVCNGLISADLRIYDNETTLASDIDLNGDLIIESGATFTMTSHTLTLNGDWINNGTFTSGVGLIKLAGETKDILGSSESDFNHLTILDGASYTLNPSTANGDIDINGQFEMESGSSLSIASEKYFDLYSSGADVESIILNGDISAVSVYSGIKDIDINNTVELSGTGNINADLRIYDNTTTLSSDFDLIGDFIIRSGATFTMTSHKLYVSGDWSSPGDFDSGTGAVIFNPDDDRTIHTFTTIASGVVASNNNFWDLSIEAASGKTVKLERDGTGTEVQTTNPYSGHLRVKNNLEVLSGTFSTGDSDVPGRKLISNNVTLVEEGATLNFGGLSTNENSWGYFVSTFYGDLILRGNITTSRPIISGYAEIFLLGARLKSSGNVDEFACDVQISTAAVTTQESDVYIKGDLIIQDDGTLKCESNKVLTIGGNLYLYENMTHKGTVNVYGNMTSGGYTTNEVVLNTSVFNFIQSASKYTYIDKKIWFGEINIIGGTRVFRQDIDCANDLTITNGSIMDMYVTTPKNLSLSHSANWVNDGTFTPYTGKVSFTGDAAQNITGTSQTTFYNLEVDNSGSGVYPQNIAKVSNQLILTNGVFNTSTSKYISLLDQSSVSPDGGQTNSFVNGPIFKTGRDGDPGDYSFVFPTGKNGVWARIASVHNGGTTATTDVFMAEYFDFPYPVLSFDASIEAVSNFEYWNLSKISGNADLQKKVKLFSEDKDLSGIVSFITDDDLTVAHFNTVTQKWEDVGLTDSDESGITGWVISDFNSDFSPFTFGSKTGGNPLPVSLLGFDAEMQNKKVLTKWSTASEYNTDYYIVQKSKGLDGFMDVGIVKATGFSNEIMNYAFTDVEPWDNISYYRLKIVDFDNTYSYSNIVAVNNPVNYQLEDSDVVASFEFVSLYPNPVKDEFYVLVNANENTLTALYITDISGKLVSQKQILLQSGENLITLHADNFVAGFYIVTLGNNTTRLSKKFVKQ